MLDCMASAQVQLSGAPGFVPCNAEEVEARDAATNEHSPLVKIGRTSAIGTVKALHCRAEMAIALTSSFIAKPFRVLASDFVAKHQRAQIKTKNNDQNNQNSSSSEAACCSRCSANI